MQAWKKYFQISLYFIAALVIIILIGKYFAVTGELKFSYDFCDKPNLISAFTPSGRALAREKNLENSDCYQKIIGEPVYFSVQAPRSFDEAEVNLVYRNPEQKIVELGIQKSAEWLFDLQAIENKFIDNSEWDKIIENDLLLLQKEKKFSSINDFLNNLPVESKIATYNYNPKFNYKMDNDIKLASEQVFDYSLLGKHEFYTYINNNENLDFTFQWFSLDKNLPSETLKINISQDNIVKTINIDSNSDIHEKNINLSNLSEGVYKISFDISDNIVISQIKTKQQYFVIKNKLHIINNNYYSKILPTIIEKESKIISNSNILWFQAKHDEGLQTVNINNEELVINRIENMFYWRNTANNEKLVIEIPQNDLIINSFGYFTFNDDSFFDPDYAIDSINNDMNIDNYDYIIAKNYTQPQANYNWLSASTVFNLTGVPGDRKKMNFVVSAPGLADVKQGITIKEINITLKRNPLTLKEIFNKLKSRF